MNRREHLVTLLGLPLLLATLRPRGGFTTPTGPADPELPGLILTALADPERLRKLEFQTPPRRYYGADVSGTTNDLLVHGPVNTKTAYRLWPSGPRGLLGLYPTNRSDYESKAFAFDLRAGWYDVCVMRDARHVLVRNRRIVTKRIYGDFELRLGDRVVAYSNARQPAPLPRGYHWTAGA